MSAAGGRITAGAGANLLGVHAEERNQEATCYVGNLDTQVTEELLWELFTQVGPVASVYLPKDRVTGGHQGYGFVEFRSNPADAGGGGGGNGNGGSDDAEYASRVLNMVRLHGKALRVTRSAAMDGSYGAGGGGAGATQGSTAGGPPGLAERDVGANLFVGGLAADVDEKALYDTFSAFGAVIATPRIVRDPDTGLSKGFGFVSFDSFEASDAAVEAMNGQFFFNRAIVVTYAFRKDAKGGGERHGTPAERLIAAQRRARAQTEAQKGGGGGIGRTSLLPAPHTRFADGPPGQQAGGGAMAMAPPMQPPPPMHHQYHHHAPPQYQQQVMGGYQQQQHHHMPPPMGMMYGGAGGMPPPPMGMPPPPPMMPRAMPPPPPMAMQMPPPR